MAETMGFIIGEYTVPETLPIIYVTDSNNARTLQRNLKNGKDFTHRKMTRSIKQGIDQAIANHLEYLTLLWPSRERICRQTPETYERGERICRTWIKQEDDNTFHTCSLNKENDSINSTTWDTSSSSSLLTSGETQHYMNNQKEKNYDFDSSMLDCLGRIIIVKVSSHQVNSDFTLKSPRKKLTPYAFIVSANQIADNAATQAQTIYGNLSLEAIDTCFYLPFSLRWNFSVEGCLTNKGATKVLYERMDEELSLRQKHRPKQGLNWHITPYKSLSFNQIGDESLLRNLMKMTTPCWTRCIYRYPHLVNQTWKHWRN